MAGASDGVIIQEKGGWKLVRPPTPGYVRTITRYAGGLVVTGEGFFYLYTQGHWVPKKTDEFFRSGISVSGTALLVGRRSVCAVTPGGELVTVRQYSGESNIKLHQIENRIYVLTTKEPPMVWVISMTCLVGLLPVVESVMVAAPCTYRPPKRVLGVLGLLI